ncbi:MAG TPA: hemerythrin [Sulfurihydrogenibium sp.]|nr:hemerythrin [Sulfurihydrogenibium sp.]
MEVINMEENILDVRNVVPFERHRLIFETFNNLKEGENFILINDHDPKPLYYQFKYELEGQFNWEYIQSGPDVWKIIIGKK